ncbi:phosphoribosyltransferase [Paeniglutamicibacter cryotolerans]|uniref:Putative phosphoribosyltransferase n=1 Tax=Paeniglutamicibacter cryotolerans TaxID=670079 RepID=A0A839QJQ2_9MICC|nr:phosphoribosyltransferase family protein [Paeniglutamicibacter cryotolerans]MBB2996429.1 putative phosphoribosyltransferase [Paeniglutamicibacter cryotolerans]
MSTVRKAPDRFADRVEAGAFLAEDLTEFSDAPDVLVLGLMRGGVPVAAEIARVLGVAVDGLAVRKLGLPERSETAFGALASHAGTTALKYVERVWGPAQQHFTPDQLEAVEAEARIELQRLQDTFVGEMALPVAGNTVILVDDGMATGATMLAAIEVIRAAGPARIVVAVPVAPAVACREIEPLVDRLLCAIVPRVFHSVSAFYSRFDQVDDAEVIALIPHF